MSDEQWTLLLCPFCYGSAFIGFWCSEDGVTQEWRGECSVCGAHGPWRKVKAEAITAWNTRAQPPVVAELVGDIERWARLIKAGRGSHGPSCICWSCDAYNEMRSFLARAREVKP